MAKLWCDIHKWNETHDNDHCKKQLICAMCKKTGHKTTECRTVMCHHCKRTNNPKGFWGHKDENCFLLQTCSRCNEKGHHVENCRTILCEYCKNVLKNGKFFGHTDSRCFLKNPCSKCNKLGHQEDQCLNHLVEYKKEELMKLNDNNDIKKIDKDNKKDFPDLLNSYTNKKKISKLNLKNKEHRIYRTNAIILNRDFFSFSVPRKEHGENKKINHQKIIIIIHLL